MIKQPNTTPKKKLAKPKRVKVSNKYDLFVRLVKSVHSLDVVKEYQFTPDRKWRIDYAIPSHKVAIEVEGGAFSNGRHTRGKGFVDDMEKYNEITCQGWALIRVTPQNLIAEKTLQNVQRCANLCLFLQKNVP